MLETSLAGQATAAIYARAGAPLRLEPLGPAGGQAGAAQSTKASSAVETSRQITKLNEASRAHKEALERARSDAAFESLHDSVGEDMLDATQAGPVQMAKGQGVTVSTVDNDLTGDLGPAGSTEVNAPGVQEAMASRETGVSYEKRIEAQILYEQNRAIAEAHARQEGSTNVFM